MIKLPTWISLWLLFSILITSWETGFILLRPESLSDQGNYLNIWLPYLRYVKIDTSYADLSNEFIKFMPCANIIEISIALLALYFNFLRKTAFAILFAFSSLLLTGTKTITVFMLEAYDRFSHVAHNPLFDLIFMYILPNSLWIIFPFMGVFILGYSLITQLEA